MSDVQYKELPRYNIHMINSQCHKTINAINEALRIQKRNIHQN
jgi:hypothetical protein